MKIGALAELAAAHYLCQQGLKLVAQNFRCRFGEIDLILLDGTTLVFVEVRLRNSDKFGGAAASINISKQHKLICTAQYYLNILPRMPSCRFDVVLMRTASAQAILNSEGSLSNSKTPFHDLKDEDIIWIRNAFES